MSDLTQVSPKVKVHCMAIERESRTHLFAGSLWLSSGDLEFKRRHSISLFPFSQSSESLSPFCIHCAWTSCMHGELLTAHVLGDSMHAYAAQ